LQPGAPARFCAAVPGATSKSASSGRPSGLNTRYVTRTDTQCNDEPYKADSEGAVEGGVRTAMRSADIRQVPEGLLTEGAGQLCNRQASDKVRRDYG